MNFGIVGWAGLLICFCYLTDHEQMWMTVRTSMCQRNTKSETSLTVRQLRRWLDLWSKPLWGYGICNSICCVINCVRRSFPYECLLFWWLLQLADRSIILAGFSAHRHRLYGTTRLTRGFLYTNRREANRFPPSFFCFTRQYTVPSAGYDIFTKTLLLFCLKKWI